MAVPLTKPLVSIGLPVYNGERYLDKTLSSLLGQSLPDFELIISDNASTDRTREMCEALERSDGRVRYNRQRFNRGAARNWNFVVQKARGEFFKWASASDLVAPQMLEKCVEALQSDPTVVLCYGRTKHIDEQGNLLENQASHDIEVLDESPSQRFANVCSALSRNNAQSGVFRLNVLMRTRLDRLFPTGDLPLMHELALYGKFKLLDDVLLFRRMSPDTFTQMLSPLERQRLYDPTATKPLGLLLLRRRIDNVVSIGRAPISLTEKLRAYRSLLSQVWRNRTAMMRELRGLFTS